MEHYDDDVMTGNRLISEFMGLKVVCYNDTFYWHSIEKGYVDIVHSERYHSSWEKLMPVWEKIGQLPEIDEMEITRKKAWIKAYKEGDFKNKLLSLYMVGDKYNADDICNSLLEAIWLGVVEFINWYQKQK
jgi:hypothetical protein